MENSNNPITVSILLVDDSEEIREPLKIMLEAEGYRVISTNDVYNSISLLERNQIDLILLDWQMPNGDGSVLLEKMKEDLSIQIPVLLMTARIPNGLSEYPSVAGIIKKPFMFKDVIRQIQLKTKNKNSPKDRPN